MSTSPIFLSLLFRFLKRTRKEVARDTGRGHTYEYALGPRFHYSFGDLQLLDFMDGVGLLLYRRVLNHISIILSL